MTLSRDALQYLDLLYEEQGTYRPNLAVATKLASKQMLVFVGPTCVGKNMVMETIAATDKRFRIVGTFTSRDPRPNEKGYTYYENTDSGLAPILADIKEHRVVQYAVNRYAHTLYGSTLDDYPCEFNMGDVLSSAVSQFEQLGFQRVITFSLTTDPAPWLEQFERRFPPNHPQREARRNEAIESITWSLSQSGNSHFWIINTHGKQTETARHIIKLATGTSQSEHGGRDVAKTLLQVVQGIKV
jgi:guanylate kinase